MSQQSLIGHAAVLEKFSRWLASGRLASTYLFAGPEGIGKYLTARHIARCLLCENSPRQKLVSCGSCSACQQVDAFSHPDLLEVRRPADKNLIPIELLIGRLEMRMREGLCHDLSMRPYRGGYRIAIIDDADFLNQEGANCLLKTLEEPPAYALIILISASEHRQLPTIRSRSQIVRFAPLSPDEVRQILEQQITEEPRSPAALNSLSLASAGSLYLAQRLSEEGAMEFRGEFFAQLATLDPTDNEFYDTVSSFVDNAGKDASAKRDRMRVIAELGTQFFRQVMLGLGCADSPCDATMEKHVASCLSRWCGDIETAVRCIERCVDVRGDIAANANQALLIECWLSDLGRIMRGEPVVAM
jgi:DNA polymerase III subunit delta'